MSRKRLRTHIDENAAWYAKRDRERAEALQRAESQRKPVPGFKRQEIDDTFANLPPNF